ncbi:MAG: glycosyltransferase family 39 protein [Novosphingobium sp.]
MEAAGAYDPAAAALRARSRPRVRIRADRPAVPGASSDISASTATLLLFITVAVAAALRLIGGNGQLWYDEIRTLVGSVREPLGTIVSHFPSNNDHVLYSLLSHVSIALFGETPLTVRLPAILFGIGSIPLIYWLGRSVTTRFEALAAALLGAVAAHHIWFSQNARGYTLLLVFALIGTRMIVEGIERRSLRPWLVFAVVSALGAYTHLTTIFAVIGQAMVVGIYLLSTRRLSFAEARGPLIGFGVAALLTLLLYVPMIGDVAAFFGESGAGPKAAGASWAILELVRNLRFGFDGGLVLLVGAAIFLIGLGSYLRQSPLIPALFFVPPAVVYGVAAALSRPTFPRFFFFVAGFLLLVGVRGVFSINRFALSRLGPRWIGWEKPVQCAAVAAMVLVLTLDLARTYLRPKMDYDGALAFAEAQRRPGEPILLGETGAGYVYTQYYHRAWPELTGADDLRARRRAGDVLVVHTFERYLDKGQPALLAELRTRCFELRNFPGTLYDGDIHVSRCPHQP